MRIGVFITALNEEKNIASVIDAVNQDYEVVVVDDGSSDKTEEIAQSKGAKVIKHCITLGQGYANVTGLKFLLSEGYDLIVKIDGDGQHYPKEIEKGIRCLLDNNYDVAIGSRILGNNYKEAPLLRKTFLPHVTGVIDKVTGFDLTDSMSGFRIFKGESLRKVMFILDELSEPQYFAAEMLIIFSKYGLKVGEFPINLKKRESGTSYKGLFRHGWGVGKAIIMNITWGKK